MQNFSLKIIKNDCKIKYEKKLEKLVVNLKKMKLLGQS